MDMTGNIFFTDVFIAEGSKALWNGTLAILSLRLASFSFLPRPYIVMRFHKPQRRKSANPSNHSAAKAMVEASCKLRIGARHRMYLFSASPARHPRWPGGPGALPSSCHRHHIDAYRTLGWGVGGGPWAAEQAVHLDTGRCEPPPSPSPRRAPLRLFVSAALR